MRLAVELSIKKCFPRIWGGKCLCNEAGQVMNLRLAILVRLSTDRFGSRSRVGESPAMLALVGSQLPVQEAIRSFRVLNKVSTDREL